MWPPAFRRVLLPLAYRVLLVAAYYRTNLTMRQLAPLFGIKTAAVHRIIDRLGPYLALAPSPRRHGPDTVPIVDGTLVPTRDRTVAAPAKNYRYSANMQVLIDASTRLVVAVGQPQPGNRNDCQASRVRRFTVRSAGPPFLPTAATRATGC
jgi:Helix-turn-helix of DDE superfamily endonuclease/Transposase DDE domain